MTYVCGYQDRGINFIICDTRITWTVQGKENKTLDAAVKSGQLFNGCIFARAGNMRNSEYFILAAKQRTALCNTPVQCWEEFIRFVEEYPFPTQDHFTLLLSTRAYGSPQFYEVDSKTGLKVCEEEIIGLGSGADLLNPVVQQDLKGIARTHQAQVDDLPLDASGYFLCQYLTLYAQSEDTTLLGQHHVGGIFHFMAQTSEQEYRQRATLFGITAFNPPGKDIYLWFHRVLPILNGIVVETYVPPQQDNHHPSGKVERGSFFDVTSTPEVVNYIYDSNTNREFHTRVNNEVNLNEFYYFFGWGSAYSQYRHIFGWQFRSESDEMMMSPDGDIHPDFATILLRQVRGTLDLEGTVTIYSANKYGRALQTQV